MKLIFATNNPHKQEEAQVILGPAFHILTPASLGFPGDLPETHETLRRLSGWNCRGGFRGFREGRREIQARPV